MFNFVRSVPLPGSMDQAMVSQPGPGPAKFAANRAAEPKESRALSRICLDCQHHLVGMLAVRTRNSTQRSALYFLHGKQAILARLILQRVGHSGETLGQWGNEWEGSNQDTQPRRSPR
jgi:hypothetical protein